MSGPEETNEDHGRARQHTRPTRGRRGHCGQRVAARRDRGERCRPCCSGSAPARGVSSAGAVPSRRCRRHTGVRPDLRPLGDSRCRTEVPRPSRRVRSRSGLHGLAGESRRGGRQVGRLPVDLDGCLRLPGEGGCGRVRRRPARSHDPGPVGAARRLQQSDSRAVDGGTRALDPESGGAVSSWAAAAYAAAW